MYGKVVKAEDDVEYFGELRGIIVTSQKLHGTVAILKNNRTYAGPYVVTPKASEQILYTSEKVMNDDVLVEGIPYFEVSNTSGGMTAIIGGNE